MDKSPEINALQEMSETNASFAAIFTTEIAEVKAMLQTVLHIQKRALLESGRSQSEIDKEFQEVFDGFLKACVSAAESRLALEVKNRYGEG